MRFFSIREERAAQLVEQRALDLWPGIAAACDLPEADIKVIPMHVNRRFLSRRCVLQLRLSTGARYVLRAEFSPDHVHWGNKCIERHRAAADALAGCAEVQVPKLLWQHDELPIVLMDWADGETAARELALSELGMSNRDELLRRVGAAVAQLHAVSATGQKQFWPKRFLEKVAERAALVRSGEVQIARSKRFLGMCAYLHRAARRARGCQYDAVLEHGDLQFQNMLITDDQVSIIDFSTHRGTYPQRDIVMLLQKNLLVSEPAPSVTLGFGRIPQQDLDAFQRGHGKDLTGDPVFQFLFANQVFENWWKLRLPIPEGQAPIVEGEGADSLVRVFDALLETETASE